MIDADRLIRAILAQCDESGPEWYPMSDPQAARSFAESLAELYELDAHQHSLYYYDLDHKPFPGICMTCGVLKEEAL